VILSTAIPDSESINLDGVESVLGSIVHDGCDPEEEKCDQPSSLFNISSSTLKSVNGSIQFRYYSGLENLLLPNLEVVNGSVFLSGLSNLRYLDVTDLAYVGSFSLDAPVLERLDIDRLQGFTNDDGGVTIWDIGSVDSVDAFFKYPSQVDNPEAAFTTDISIRNQTNLRNVTIAWPNMSGMHISHNITVTLGDSSTKAMHIQTLEIPAGFHRNSKLQNLTVGRVSVTNTGAFEKLTLPFDELVGVQIEEYSPDSKLNTIVLPAEAANWTDPTLQFFVDSLHFREYDDDGTKIWYWPETINRLSLVGNVSTNFL
jgi:hypothetical protein